MDMQTVRDFWVDAKERVFVKWKKGIQDIVAECN
jgi:hypothetical protein